MVDSYVSPQKSSNIHAIYYVPVQVQTTILERIRETPGLPLSALAYDGSGICPNDVYAVLALDLLYTDLYAAPLIQHGRVRLYTSTEQARAYADLLPSKLLNRVGSPLPEVSMPLTPNITLLWDGRAFTLVNPGETTITLLPDKGPPIQVPSDFFFQLFDTGVITRLRPEEDAPISPDVDRLMDQATPDDKCQANERVLPLSVVDNSALSPTRLTIPRDPVYPS
jgi:putative transposase